MAVKKTNELTPKQSAFCDEYIIDLNGSAAAKRAGYTRKASKEAASVLLTNPNVAKRIEKLMDVRAKQAGLVAENVIKGIVEVIEDAKKMKQTEFGETMTNHTAALKGLELLGKHLAMWTDKKVVDSNVKLTGFEISGE